MAVVGIDLGTTNTVVASVRGGRVQVIADDHGRRLLPSVVSFHPSGEVLVGYAAKERIAIDAKNTIASVKRLIGRAWDSDEIRRSRQRFAFDLNEGSGQGPLVVARGHEYTLPEISAFVLKRAKQIADSALGEPVDRAVITVPANFNELQRAATKVAGRIAGLDVLRIINEPTAAALAYGLGRANRERIAIYDFGGGTFDCTLLHLSGSVFEVLATAGDSFLGGDDIDLAIAERMADAFVRAHRYDARAHPQAFERLRSAAEGIKISLSMHPQAVVRLREIAFGVGGSQLDLDFTMTRDELDAIAAPLVERTFMVCQEALSMARLPVAAFDKVILVGGTTRVKLVRRRVEHFFRRAPLDRVNPEEVVAMGAAIQAAALTDLSRRQSVPPPPTTSTWRTPPPEARLDDDDITLATSVPAQIAALHRSSRPPAGDFEPVRPSSSPPSSGAGGLVGAPVLVDVTPRALVVETVGGWCDVIVPRNAKIPCEHSRAFATSADGQTVVRVRVAQGEEAFFRHNTFLGEVELTGLRAAARGAVTIQVRFEVDESGTLQVFATDVATGREAHALLQLVGIAGAQSVAEMRVRHAAVQVR
ncbi:MAG: Hsp70 family protein [Polyangiaceae bacterium]|jgi:molecular chaperone DnaK (HSP70)